MQTDVWCLKHLELCTGLPDVRYFLGSGSVMITSERLDLTENLVQEGEWDREKADTLYINFDYGPKNVDVDMQFAQVVHDRTTPDNGLKTVTKELDDYRIEQQVHRYSKFREELDAVSGLFQLTKRGREPPCWTQVTSQVSQRETATIKLFGQNRKKKGSSNDTDELENPWTLKWDTSEVGFLGRSLKKETAPGSFPAGRWVLSNSTLRGYLQDLTDSYGSEHAPLGRTRLELRWEWLDGRTKATQAVPSCAIPLSVVEFIDLPRPPQHFGEMEMM